LISDNGAILISDKGGQVVGGNGATVVGGNGATVVGGNGATVVAPGGARLRLALAGGLPEALLRDARVAIADARGQILVDEAGQPLGASTDATGAFRIDAALPDEALVLRVPLAGGGELRALLPRSPLGEGGDAGAAGVPPLTLDIDTAATLGATYVLDQFVRGDQAVFNKLPVAESARLQADLMAAGGLITRPPAYDPAALVALTEVLRGQAAAVDQTLAAIRVLLLGQARLGAGRPATDVPLSGPDDVLRLADGALLISEELLGRVRHVAPDGGLTTWIDALTGEKARTSYFSLADLEPGPGGAVDFVHGYGRKVRRLTPAGQVVDLAGSGAAGRAGEGGPALDAAMFPDCLLREPDGTLLIGEYLQAGVVPRVLALGAAGRVAPLAAGPEAWMGLGIGALARAADGTRYALLRHPAFAGGLWALKPAATAWTLVDADVKPERVSALLALPDGGLLLSEDSRGRLLRYDPGGARTVFFSGGGLVRPAGMWREADGAILVADPGAAVVWRLQDGALTRVAGQGDAGGVLRGGAIALNQPGDVALGARGRLLVTESGRHALKAWDGQALSTVAGSVAGFAGDGGPAAAAQLNSPSGVVADGDATWLMDQGNGRLRRVAGDGTISTVAGGGVDIQILGPEPVAPAAYRVSRPQDLTLDPTGRPAWCVPRVNQIHHLLADGRVALVAGKDGVAGDAGDGGPAAEALLNAPAGLTRGPDGALYIADSGNMRIRRVVGLGGATPPVMEAWAGRPTFETFGELAAGSEAAVAGATREAMRMLAPVALCFDPAGNLYVAEIGTLYLPMFAGVTAVDPRAMSMLADLPKVPPRVRRIAPDGTVTVVAGPGGRFFTDPTADDALVLPTALTIDGQGRLVIMDAGANTIRFCSL